MPRESGVRRFGAALIVAFVGLGVGAAPVLLGPPGGDDAYYHAMYALEQARCWRGGVPFPSWYPDLNAGLGGPEPRARPQLSLALGAAFALLLDDAVTATSLATALIPAVAGLVMFAIARRRGRRLREALLLGVVWSSVPYLLVTLHERAALQEAWAVALLPWVMDSLLPPAPATRSQVLGGAVGFGVILATQLLVGYMVGLIVIAAHALSRSRRPAALAGTLALGLGLAAWSWLPAVLGLRRVQAGVFSTGWSDWRQRFLFSATDPAPALNHHMVLVAMAALAAAAVLITMPGRPRALAAGAVAAVLLATPLARPVWEALPGFALLQFPWRWLGLASILVVVALADGKFGRGSSIAGALLILPMVLALTSAPRLDPGLPLRPSDSPSQAALAATRYGVPPILPSSPPMLPRGVDLGEALRAAPAARQELPVPNSSGPRTWSWQLDRKTSGLLMLPLLADDGWRVRVDAVLVPWHPTQGLVSVAVAAGHHTVTAVQVALPESLAGAGISVVALVAWLWLWRGKADTAARSAGHGNEPRWPPPLV
ncbi:MAG: 6-pyruvoyl-tetrahydropterin synthase-related protein [Thermoanaerobaculales bacterium]